MSRQFSMLTVLRMAPNKLLLELFRGLGYPYLDKDWDGLKEREIEPIQKAISERSVEEQSRIERELRAIFDLACGPGIDSIVEACAIAQSVEFRARASSGRRRISQVYLGADQSSRHLRDRHADS